MTTKTEPELWERVRVNDLRVKDVVHLGVQPVLFSASIAVLGTVVGLCGSSRAVVHVMFQQGSLVHPQEFNGLDLIWRKVRSDEGGEA